MPETTTEPALLIRKVSNPKGYVVVIDDHVERFEASLYAAEQFCRGVEWAAREFGWASDRLKRYGELAQTAVLQNHWKEGK
jgi:hypothetical protein